MTGKYFSLMSVLILFPFFAAAQQTGMKIETNSHQYKPGLSRVNEKEINKFSSGLLADTLQPPLIKSDFVVNSFGGDYGALQQNVCAAMDGNGYYALTWMDSRNGLNDIYIQLYDSNDVKIGSNTKVNDQKISSFSRPFIACNEKGDYVIVWLQDGNRIMAQRFNRREQKTGSNIEVIYQWEGIDYPSAAVNTDGSFIVIWSTGYFVEASIFDKWGNPFTTSILVSDYGYIQSGEEQGKKVAVDGSGDYHIVWSSYYGGQTAVYFQTINDSGARIGQNIIISRINNFIDKSYPRIAATKDGSLLITWMTYKESEIYGIEGRICSSDGNSVTDVLQIWEGWLADPGCDISSDRDSVFFILWEGHNNPGSQHSYFSKIKSNGEFLTDTLQIPDIPGSPLNLFRGGITDAVNNTFIVAAEGDSRNDKNVYSEKFNSNLEQVSSMTKVNDDRGASIQENPLVKFNKQEESIILWEDGRNGRTDLFAQVYDRNFNAVGENIMINETEEENWILTDKKVQVLSDGTFVIAFSGLAAGNLNRIAAQWVGPDGKKIGGNKVLLNEANYGYNYFLAMNINSEDQMLLCWHNPSSWSMGYFRKYDRYLVPLSDIAGLPGTFAAVSVDQNLKIFLVRYSGYYSLDGIILDETGAVVVPDFKIENSDYSVLGVSCFNDSGSYAVIFNANGKLLRRGYFNDGPHSFTTPLTSIYETDIIEIENRKILMAYSTIPDIFALYLNDNSRVSELYRLHSYGYNDHSGNGKFDADIFENNLLLAYNINSTEGTGKDIYAKVSSLNIDFNEEVFFPLQSNDFLYSNYPNPFNTTTKIVYEILSFHNVKLAVYDVLGREVKVLVNQPQEKGLYQVDFDASGLTSGIYFCRLEAFNTTVKKMILLK